MKKFFANVGKKVQAYAKLNAVCGMVITAIGIVLPMFNDALFEGMALIMFGLVAICMSFPLFAFGQMVDDVHEIKGYISKMDYNTVNDLPEL